MTTELRVDVLDGADGEHGGLGAELEVGGYAAQLIPEVADNLDEFNHVTAHADTLTSGDLLKFWTYPEILQW